MFIRMLSAFVDAAKARKDRGAVAGEYAVLLALIAVALVAIIGFFTAAIVRAFQAAIDVLP